MDYLFEVGPSSGGEIITFQEMQAWQAMGGPRLDAWEAVTLRALSAAYLSEYSAASEPDRPPPYTPISAEPVDHKSISNARLEMFLRLQAQHEGREYDPEAKPDPVAAPEVHRRSAPKSDAHVGRRRR